MRDEIFGYFPVLGQRLRQRAGTLSGGEQKMLTLAKALVSMPDLLVLDEISDGLGPAVISMVGVALRSIRERHGCTILMVEQNLDLSLDVADRVAVLKLGNLIFERDAAEAGLREELVTQLAPPNGVGHRRPRVECVALHAVSDTLRCQTRNPRSRIAFSFRISGRTSSRIGSSAKSASQRSGVMKGKSEPKSTFSRRRVFA